MTELLRKMWSADEGQDMVEYATLFALITLALVIALTSIGGTIANMFQSVVSAF